MKRSDSLKFIFLTYYFPPIGGAGVQRSLKFIKYLPEYGYEPIVVTGPGEFNSHWSPKDDTLMDDLRENTQIYRIQTPFINPSGKRTKIKKYLFLESSFRKWWFSNCIKIISEVIRRDKPQFIFSSMSPFESTYVTNYFYKYFQLPWVADLRDPWALDEMQIYSTFVHQQVEKSRMRRLLSTAEGLVLNTPEAHNKFLNAFPEYSGKSITSITNGYDGEDFNGFSKVSKAKFTIVHTGYLHTELGFILQKRRVRFKITGGVSQGLDILTRSHYYLLKAVEQLIEEIPEVSKFVEVILAGNLSNTDLAIVNESKIAHIVKTPGYINHKESLALIQSAAVLFLPMHNLPAGARASIVPGKTYEYMATTRPIIAAVPEGDTKDFLMKRGCAYICRPNDSTEILKSLKDAFTRWQNNTDNSHEIDGQFVSMFERKYLTQLLASFFRKVQLAD